MITFTVQAWPRTVASEFYRARKQPKGLVQNTVLFKIQIPSSHLPFCLRGLYLATSQGGADVGGPKDTLVGTLAYVHGENRASYVT